MKTFISRIYDEHSKKRIYHDCGVGSSLGQWPGDSLTDE
jgi:hypothetical protein